jgi:16S rRNA (uracil1498-N3)-methyltransferase
VKKSDPTMIISLYQAFPNKLDKIEYIIEKGIEIGIQKFIFFRSEFSQKLLLTETKKERLISIAREALEQCGGNRFPEIQFLDRWPDVGGLSSSYVLDTLSDDAILSL